jgi:creatinine amidohydrolase/Fe(II)-dependent formamide hydrolase-like protein
VVPFAECLILPGDHAGLSETSFMLHLDKALVDLTQIREVNYRDHEWDDASSPEKATAAKGQQDVQAVIAYLQGKIAAAFSRQAT